MIFAMFCMVIVTTIVGLTAFVARVKSVKSGQVKAKTFTLMRDEPLPDIVQKTTRNFNNQFEVPVLFYIACTLHVALDISNPISLVFAWAFVILRAIHAYIHITYNHLLHRIVAFWLAFFSVVGLWGNLVLLVKTV